MNCDNCGKKLICANCSGLSTQLKLSKEKEKILQESLENKSHTIENFGSTVAKLRSIDVTNPQLDGLNEEKHIADIIHNSFPSLPIEIRTKSSPDDFTLTLPNSVRVSFDSKKIKEWRSTYLDVSEDHRRQVNAQRCVIVSNILPKPFTSYLDDKRSFHYDKQTGIFIVKPDQIIDFIYFLIVTIGTDKPDSNQEAVRISRASVVIIRKNIERYDKMLKDLRGAIKFFTKRRSESVSLLVEAEDLGGIKQLLEDNKESDSPF